MPQKRTKGGQSSPRQQWVVKGSSNNVQWLPSRAKALLADTTFIMQDITVEFRQRTSNNSELDRWKHKYDHSDHGVLFEETSTMMIEFEELPLFLLVYFLIRINYETA